MKAIRILVPVIAAVSLAACSSLQTAPTRTPPPAGGSTPVVGANGPSTAKTGGCVPFPYPATDSAPRTPTPGRFSTPSVPPPAPTFTPIPYARAIDLDPAYPEQDKYYVEVFRCDGVFETWILGLWRPLDSIPLQAGDQIIQQMVGRPGIQATLHLPPPLASPYPTPLSPALDYDPSPDNVLFYANNNPGGFPHLGEMPSCSRIPHLRVWGDGRFVYRPGQTEAGPVLVGKADDGTVIRILALLDQNEFFAPWVTQGPVSQGGKGFDLTVNLRAGRYSYYWYNPPVLYDQIVALLDPGHLEPFIPQEAVLKITPYYAPVGSDKLPEWRPQFGFDPRQVGQSGLAISGPALADLWQTMRGHPEIPLGFKYGGKAYAYWLEIVGITEPQPPGVCVSVPILPTPAPIPTRIYPAPE